MPVGSFQGVIDYTEPTGASLDFVYWYRNRFPIAGEFSQYNLKTTTNNILDAKSKQAEEELDSKI